MTNAVTVLRDGKLVGSWATSEVDVSTITRAMVGDLANERGGRRSHVGGVAAELRAASGPGLAPIDLALSGGEIVGLVGLEGSGISTVMEMLGGVVPIKANIVWMASRRAFGTPSRRSAPGSSICPPIARKTGCGWIDRRCGT